MIWTWLSLGLLTGILLFLNDVFPVSVGNDTFQTDNTLNQVPFDGQFTITSDEDLAGYATQGTGTETNPYILEDLNVSISVTNTTKHFVIRNCWIEGGNSGIYIVYVAEGTAQIVNNTCLNNEYGIYIGGSIGTMVLNNTCINNGMGIGVNGGYHHNISRNLCTNNTKSGIYFYGSSSSSLVDNQCIGNRDGIYSYYSQTSGITNNTLSQNEEEGLDLTYAINMNVYRNLLE